MDDVRALATTWCDEALGLSGTTAGSRVNGDEPAGAGPSGTLTAQLDAIGEGIRLRRRLDGLVPDEETESCRRAIVCRLADLQRLAGEELIGLRPGTARHREVAARVKEWLVEARVAARNTSTVLQFEPLHEAMALEALRADLEWLSIVVARLDNEAPQAPSVWLDVDLERLRGTLGAPDARNSDPRDEPIRARCERMKAELLERRVRRELGRPLHGDTPEFPWAQRFALSRIQAQVAALDLESVALSTASGGPAEWLENLGAAVPSSPMRPTHA